MIKRILIAILCVLFAIPAEASYESKIQELMKIMNIDIQEQYISNQLITPVVCAFDMPANDEDKVRYRILRVLDFKNKMVEMVKPVWEENFTEEEIDEILAFYKTKVGQKTIALMPKISQRITLDIIKYQQEITPQLDNIATDLISNYHRRSEAEMRLCLQRHIK